MREYPIVLLHGWGLSAAVFEPLTSELAGHHYKVYTPDLPGFGDSIIPDHALTLADYVVFLEDYFKKNKINDPILVGHSFGGRVALRFVKAHPTAVHALVLTGAPGYTSVAKRKLILITVVAKVGKLFFLIPFLRLLEDHVRRWYYYVVGARDYYRAQGKMRDTFKNIVREELVTSMRSVRVPTLLVWGEEDIIVPVAVGKRMKETIANATLITVPLTGHGLPFKHPKLFCSQILPWLTQV